MRNLRSSASSLHSIFLVSKMQLVLVAMAAVAVQSAPTDAANGLKVEVYGNSVMRGVPRCTAVMANGFSTTVSAACKGSTHPIEPCDANGVNSTTSATTTCSQTSVRITATLAPPAMAATWYNFSATVGEKAWVRLWIDDHRIIDAWGKCLRACEVKGQRANSARERETERKERYLFLKKNQGNIK